MSRQQSVLRNTVGYMLKNIDNQATNGEEKSKPGVIKLGLDLHARQVTECRQLDGSTPKPAQQWDPRKLLDKVEEWVKAGSKVYSCYEAGPCGYWYHRELTKCGAVNYVPVGVLKFDKVELNSPGLLSSPCWGYPLFGIPCEIYHAGRRPVMRALLPGKGFQRRSIPQRSLNRSLPASEDAEASPCRKKVALPRDYRTA